MGAIAGAFAMSHVVFEPEKCPDKAARVWAGMREIARRIQSLEPDLLIIATNDPSLFTLTRGVAQLTSGGLGSGQQFPISMAAALLMTIPTAIVFIVFQRYFTRGANAGADKG